jgi:RNA-directed DNA polymerase
MADRPTTRQELYDRVRATSKDEVVLEEMIRLGFWPAQGTTPDDPAEELRRIGELERKLQALAVDATRLQNTEQAKAELLRRRLKASRDKREETKRLREERRLKRLGSGPRASSTRCCTWATGSRRRSASARARSGRGCRR